MKNIRCFSILLITVLLASIFVGCGATSIAQDAFNAGGQIENGINFNDFDMTISDSLKTEGVIEDVFIESSKPQLDNNKSPTSNSVTSESVDDINYEKLVYKATYNIEVKEYDTAIASLKSEINNYNGIIETVEYKDNSDYGYSSYNKGYRMYYCIVRVPTESFDEFTGIIGEIGHISSSNSFVENISREYYDTKAYLDSYNAQLEKLISMYDSATTIDEMITLENRISEVQAQILKLTTKIQSMDMDVAYSTIEITIREVIDYSKDNNPSEERTFFGRLWTALKDACTGLVEFLENAVLFIVRNIFMFVILGVILFFVIRWIRKRRKKKKDTTNR